MTDRELLESAARAAGIEIFFDEDGDCYRYRVKESGNRRYWNPLDFDGDALRLAVKLSLNVEIDSDRIDVSSGRGIIATEYRYELPTPTDANAATRRAITRAAAAIGEKVK
jgi:hypothetical protein